MKFRESKTIYFVPPLELLLDVKRAIKKSSLNIDKENVSEKSWTLSASKENLRVEASLNHESRNIFPFRFLIPVSELVVNADGDDEEVEKFKWNLKVSLLRCLG